jgi:uncharacterized protein
MIHLKKWWLGLTAFSVLSLATFSNAAEIDKTGWPKSVKVGTASQGGTYFIYGAGWAGLMQETLGVNSSAEVTGGPTQNMALVQTGDLQFAMVTMGPAYDSWVGESELAPGVEMKDVRALFPMYKTPFQAIALKSSGIARVEDLAGKKVGFGPRGGTAGGNIPRWLNTLDIKVQEQYGGASDLAGQLQDGLLDAFFFAAGVPISAFSQVEAQTPVNLFSFSDEQITTLLAKYPSISPFVIPGGTYQSYPDDQNTVAMWNFTVAHKDLPESFIYEVMKLVLDDNNRMIQVHKAAEETKAENWNSNTFYVLPSGCC